MDTYRRGEEEGPREDWRDGRLVPRASEEPLVAKRLQLKLGD